MNFDEIIKKIDPAFQNLGFKKVEGYRNFVRYESENVGVSFSFNDKENSFDIFIGKLGENLFELTDKVFKEVFNENFGRAEESIVENLINFFQGKGNAILIGDPDKLEELKKYVYKGAKKYTNG